MIAGFTVKIDRKNLSCQVVGATKEKIRLAKWIKRESVMVFHTAGSNYWSSIGHQSYAPSSFCVCRVSHMVETNDALTVKIAEVIADFPVSSRNWPDDWLQANGNKP